MVGFLSKLQELLIKLSLLLLKRDGFHLKQLPYPAADWGVSVGGMSTIQVLVTGQRRGSRQNLLKVPFRQTYVFGLKMKVAIVQQC